MNHLYLFGGAIVCMLMASLIGITNAVAQSVNAASPSPYVVGGIVLLSLGLAVKNK